MNWKERIKLALKNKIFSMEDIDLSRSFRTCAVGEKFGLKYGTLALIDVTYKKSYNKVNQLGIDFWEEVKGNNIKQARTIYNKIQKFKVKGGE